MIGFTLVFSLLSSALTLGENIDETMLSIPLASMSDICILFTFSFAVTLR